jgi:hypothetical protein
MHATHVVELQLSLLLLCEPLLQRRYAVVQANASGNTDYHQSSIATNHKSNRAVLWGFAGPSSLKNNML